MHQTDEQGSSVILFISRLAKLCSKDFFLLVAKLVNSLAIFCHRSRGALEKKWLFAHLQTEARKLLTKRELVPCALLVEQKYEAKMRTSSIYDQ